MEYAKSPTLWTFCLTSWPPCHFHNQVPFALVPPRVDARRVMGEGIQNEASKQGEAQRVSHGKLSARARPSVNVRSLSLP